MTMRFEIGQTVWHAAFDTESVLEPCSHCGTTGRLRVTFHDDTQVSIACRNCARGYEPSTGYVTAYVRTPRAQQATITGLEVSQGKTEWRTSQRYSVDDASIFDNEADVYAAAVTLAEQETARELAAIATKEKPPRTWAWNASYHRKEIKRAQQSIEQHTACLSVAALKAKEDRK